jgi:hypothetical protein
VGFGDLDGVPSEGVDDLQVLLEHVRVLVILAADVLLDGSREGEGRRLAEGQAEEVAVWWWGISIRAIRSTINTVKQEE